MRASGQKMENKDRRGCLGGAVNKFENKQIGVVENYEAQDWSDLGVLPR